MANQTDIQIQTKIDDALTGSPLDRVNWTTELKPILEDLVDSKINDDLRGVAGGVAELDGGGKVPSSQLPSYIDDVIEVADFASLPVTGESGKIYVTVDTNNQYRWTGSIYVAINSGISNLDDILDVVITIPSIGDVLAFDGTNWINGAGGAAVLDNLTDVNVSGAVTGDTLIFNGTDWIDGNTIDALLTGYITGSGLATVLATDTIKEALQKLAGNDTYIEQQIGTIQVGNNLFNYYNFR